jgi:hypothetical protein
LENMHGEVVVLPCRHHFHAVCLFAGLGCHLRCPLCRESVV